MDADDALRLRGVRTRNLAGIDVEFPRGRLSAVTGVSGSGKTSLVFETLFAEAQRRYAESLPARTRASFAWMPRPDLDHAENLPAAVAVGQFALAGADDTTVLAAAGARAALLRQFLRQATAVCPECETAMAGPAPADLAAALAAAAPVWLGFRVEPAPNWRATLLAAGWIRLADAAGALVRTDGTEPLDPAAAPLYVVVERLAAGAAAAPRLTEACEQALATGAAHAFKDGAWRPLGGVPRCLSCGQAAAPLAPETFGSAGACAACSGAGATSAFDSALAIPDANRTLRMGAIAPLADDPDARKALLSAAPALGLDIDKSLAEFTPAELTALFERGAGTWPGVRAWFAAQRGVKWKCFESAVPCATCAGTGHHAGARAWRYLGKSWPDWLARTVDEARAALPAAEADRGLATLRRRFAALADSGVGYLPLGRRVGSLSTGESRRVALAVALSARLAEALFILDEPMAGAHPAEAARLVRQLQALRDAGNTVIVVEHQLAVIAAADHVVEIGPGAGAAGGEVVFEGSPADLADAEAATSPFLVSAAADGARETPGAPRGWLALHGCRARNLQGIDATFPLGWLTAVCGPSGAGKTSLVVETLLPAVRRALGDLRAPPPPCDRVAGTHGLEEVLHVTAARGTAGPASIVATYLKCFDEVRRLFAETLDAKTLGLGPGDFSFNGAAGRCPRCQGAGEIDIELRRLAPMAIPCPECRGQRYRPRVLEVKCRGRNIAETLALSARAAFGFFREERKVQERLKALLDAGLDYLPIGQATATLSGGEWRRLQLAARLADRGSKRTLFVLDEPTAGLHPADVPKLLETLKALVAVGHTVVAIDHQPWFLRDLDHLIELGPGAGPHGGRIVAVGSPAALARGDTPTGAALRHVPLAR